MKLPQNRKERIQMLALAGIGVAAMLYAVVSFGIAQRERQRRVAVKAAQMVEALAKADSEVHAMVLSGDEHRRLQTLIAVAVSNDIVQPVLGSYLLSVRDRVEQTARRTDVKLTGIQEIGLQVLPGVAGAPSRSFRSYGIQVIGTAGYGQLRAFLKELETSNPYLTVTEFSVIGHAEDPSTHGLSVRIEWPVMTRESIPTPAGGAK